MQDLAEPGVEEKEMSMTCLMVLLVVVRICFLWKYVLVVHEVVRCRSYHRGLFSERRPFIVGRARWIGHRLWGTP